MDSETLQKAEQAAGFLVVDLRELYPQAKTATEEIAVERWLKLAVELHDELRRVAGGK